MLLFWFFVFVCCAVKCDYISNNYYVIEMPELDVPKDYNTPFKVYWNVPTKQCKSKNVLFDNLEKFGIIQNENDTFEGEKITIMYDPGVFPAIFQGDSGTYRNRNGGVPQLGNLEMHLTAFRESLNNSIPNRDFSGIGIIDFESWRPIFRQQFGSLKPYIDLSMNIERKRHWWWPTSWQKLEATKRFEDAARVFMQTTLSVAKQMRPRAVWGYYAYPYCFNMGSNNMVENCSDAIKGENDKIYWLWAESTALYPSVYSSSNFTTSQLSALVKGRVTEANRVKKAGTLVLPYFWFRYRDAGYMSEEDVTTVFEALQTTNASGLIIWGSSNDVNQVDKCQQLYNYVETILGPIVKKYVQRVNKVVYDETTLDPETESNTNDTLASDSNIVTNIFNGTLNETKEIYTNNFLNTETAHLSQPIVSENISHNVQPQDMSKIYSNSNGRKVDLNSFNLSAMWEIIKKQFHFENLDIANSTSNEDNIKYPETLIHDITETSSTNFDTSTTETTLLDKNLSNGFEELGDDFLIKIDNATYPNTETVTQSTNNFIFDYDNDDLIKLVVNLTNPVMPSMNINKDKNKNDTDMKILTDSTENFVSNDKKDDSITLIVNLT